MFYVRQLGEEQLCGRRILAEFRGGRGGREAGELISVGEAEQNAKRARGAGVTCGGRGEEEGGGEGGGEEKKKKSGAADQGPASAITLP